MILSYNDIIMKVDNINEENKTKLDEVSLPLIEDFNKKNLHEASYDISVGKKILVQRENVATIDLMSKEEVDNIFDEKDMSNGYIIKPNEYVILPTLEKINMPDDLVAHIRPRTTFNKLGLITMGQHINPSFRGRINIGLKNMSFNAYIIYPGMSFAQIVFEEILSEVPQEVLYRNRESAKYQNEDCCYIPAKIYEEYKQKSIDAAREIIDRTFQNS